LFLDISSRIVRNRNIVISQAGMGLPMLYKRKEERVQG